MNLSMFIYNIVFKYLKNNQYRLKVSFAKPSKTSIR